MSKLIRLIYISRSNLQAIENVDIEPGIARILTISRINNRKRGLVGVLYFGNGCFFQCLEGEQETVDALYEKLKMDKRHSDLKVLSRQDITRLSFSQWDMKYVKIDTTINSFLESRGYSEFDPYKLDDRTTSDLIRFLKLAPDADDVAKAAAPATAMPAAATASPGMAQLSLAFSTLAVLLSIGALVIALQ